VLALMDPEKDTGAGFCLTRRTAYDDPRGADLDDTKLGGGDVVTVETASRLHPAASVQAVVRDAHLEADYGERTRSIDPQCRGGPKGC
jgi:hypothetical protein